MKENRPRFPIFMYCGGCKRSDTECEWGVKVAHFFFGMSGKSKRDVWILLLISDHHGACIIVERNEMPREEMTVRTRKYVVACVKQEAAREAT